MLLVSTREEAQSGALAAAAASDAEPVATRALVDTATGEAAAAKVYERARLAPGATVPGPAVLVEKDTTTVVSAAFEAEVHPLGHVIMTARAPDPRPDREEA